MCAGRWHVASRARTSTWNPAPPKERAPAALEGVGVRLAGVMSLGAEQNHSPGQGQRLPFPAGPNPRPRIHRPVLPAASCQISLEVQAGGNNVSPAMWNQPGRAGTGPFLRSVTPHSAPDLLPSALGAHAEPSPDPGPSRGPGQIKGQGGPSASEGPFPGPPQRAATRVLSWAQPWGPGGGGAFVWPEKPEARLPACVHQMIKGRGPGHEVFLPISFS